MSFETRREKCGIKLEKKNATFLQLLCTYLLENFITLLGYIICSFLNTGVPLTTRNALSEDGK